MAALETELSQWCRMCKTLHHCVKETCISVIHHRECDSHLVAEPLLGISLCHFHQKISFIICHFLIITCITSLNNRSGMGYIYRLWSLFKTEVIIWWIVVPVEDLGLHLHLLGWTHGLFWVGLELTKTSLVRGIASKLLHSISASWHFLS